MLDPDLIYHLTTHGVDDRPIVRDDVDRQELVQRIGRVIRAYSIECYAVCVMDTHHHLVVRGGDLSDAMRDLHGGYARAFNRRHGRRGALFESRFKHRAIADERHLLASIKYVALNPGEARLTTYPWSTYPQVIGLHDPWPFFDALRVRDLFGSVPRLRQFVESV